MEDLSDHYNSEEEAITKFYPKKSRASPRPTSAAKKSKAGHGSKRPGLAKSNPYSSALTSSTANNARDLWLKAVKNGNTVGAKNKGYVGRKSATDYWTDTLKRSGTGFTTASNRPDSLTGLKGTQSENMAYTSTSHYLRQRVGTETPRSARGEPAGKHKAGTPAYKSPEEYYDDILELKKQIKNVQVENNTMKSKMRRLEEDNLKKEKDIAQLLDPSKSEDMRRTLADGKKSDTGAVNHSLKQKILKLEHQLKDKEAAYNKLQSDLKTTKVEELKVQMEAFYQEVQRLNQLKSVDSPVTKKSASQVKETPGRLKAMQDTIMRMNDKNLKLQSENKTLKEDLQKLMEQVDTTKTKHKEYEDMTKKELVGQISKLEKRLDRAEEATSVMSDVEARNSNIEGKIQLDGTLAERLDQLDKRETELLEEIGKQKNIIKRLKEDRAHYRKRADTKDREIKDTKKEMEQLQEELDGFYDKDKVSPRQRTPRSKPSPRTRSSGLSSVVSSDRDQKRKVENFRRNHAAKSIQRQWRNHHDTQLEEEERKRRVEDFVNDRAARKIQKSWHDHKEYESDSTTDFLQSAMRGHLSRKENMSRLRNISDEEETVTESDREVAALNRSKGYGSRSSSGRRSPMTGGKYNSHRLDSEGEEAEEEYERPRSRGPKPSVSSHRQSPKPSRGATPPSRRRTPTRDHDEEDDSDDDIIVTSKSRSKFF